MSLLTLGITRLLITIPESPSPINCNHVFQKPPLTVVMCIRMPWEWLISHAIVGSRMARITCSRKLQNGPLWIGHKHQSYVIMCSKKFAFWSWYAKMLLHFAPRCLPTSGTIFTVISHTHSFNIKFVRLARKCFLHFPCCFVCIDFTMFEFPLT